MTRAEWERCIVQLRGAWPGPHGLTRTWADVWFGQLQTLDFRAVAWATVRAIREGSSTPPSLGQFIGFVRIEERSRGLTRRPPPEPEHDHGPFDPSKLPSDLQAAYHRLIRRTEIP